MVILGTLIYANAYVSMRVADRQALQVPQGIQDRQAPQEVQAQQVLQIVEVQVKILK